MSDPRDNSKDDSRSGEKLRKMIRAEDKEWVRGVQLGLLFAVLNMVLAVAALFEASINSGVSWLFVGLALLGLVIMGVAVRVVVKKMEARGVNLRDVGASLLSVDTTGEESMPAGRSVAGGDGSASTGENAVPRNRAERRRKR